MMMLELDTILSETESVCPECLARVPAVRVARGENVYLKKACPTHGITQTIIWRGKPAFSSWVRAKRPSPPTRPATEVSRGCPFDCGLCPDHRIPSCCVLLEVTRRCDLSCSFCFASAGGAASGVFELDLGTIEARLRALMDRTGGANLQFSGGEPCVRDDLPEIAALARDIGFTFIQVNSNGVRLGRDLDFARRLKAAGVSTVFLQFDGTRDAIHERMRGRALQAHKERAIEHCGIAGLGVVLVPVVVPGVNADHLGEIVRFGLAHQPTVRGVHFQPVSYFGRYPQDPTDADRITLPEIMAGLEAQTNGLVKIAHFQPAGAENALCSFNGNFVSMPDGSLRQLSQPKNASACCTPVGAPVELDLEPAGLAMARARDFVAKAWSAPHETTIAANGPSFGEWDVFLERMRTHQFCISGMAFQDAWTLDLDRLRDCHIHIAEDDGACYPFCAYNLTDRHGRSLYRRQPMAVA